MELRAVAPPEDAPALHSAATGAYRLVIPAAYSRPSQPDARSHPRWLLPGRVAWVVVATLTTVTFLVSLSPRYMQLLRPSGDVRVGLDLPATDPAQLSSSPQFYASYNLALEISYALLFSIVALVIFWRVRNDRIALLASFALLTFGTGSIPTIWPLAEAQTSWYVPATALRLIGWLSIAALLFVFPDGRFAPRWTLWAFVLYAAHLSLTLFPTSPFYPEKWPLPHTLLNLFVWGSGVFSQVYKYRHVLGRVQRQQVKWVVFGMVVGVLGALAATSPTRLEGSPGRLFYQGSLFHELVLVPLLYSFLALIPLCIGVSIVHYRLWDIDLIINRTLVYLPLTGILAGLYSASIVLFQKLSVAITGQQSDAAIVLTTLVIVSVFAPVKEKLQGVVDKSYKQTSDPAMKLKVFNKQMESFIQMNDARELAAAVFDGVAKAFRARWGAIYLDQDGQMQLVRAFGIWTDEDAYGCQDLDANRHEYGAPTISVGLQSGEKRVGLLQLGPRADGAGYSLSERETLQQTAELLAHTTLLARAPTRAAQPRDLTSR